MPTPMGACMAHKIAKLLLEHAESFLERKQAVKSAMQLGMPLNEIEDYLDWLESVRTRMTPGDDGSEPPSTKSDDAPGPSSSAELDETPAKDQQAPVSSEDPSAPRVDGLPGGPANSAQHVEKPIEAEEEHPGRRV